MVRAARPRRRVATWHRVFGAPIAIGVATLTGLLAALLIEPAGRYLSWVAVGAPVAVAAWAWLRRRR